MEVRISWYFNPIFITILIHYLLYKYELFQFLSKNKHFTICFIRLIIINSIDLPDHLLSPVPIVDRSRVIFLAKSCIGTELLYVGSCWSSCFCSSMWRDPQEYLAYEVVFTSKAVYSYVCFIIVADYYLLNKHKFMFKLHFLYRLSTPECSIHETSFAFTCIWQLEMSYSSAQPTKGNDWLVVWLFWFYGISTIVGYLRPNPFLCK